MQFKSVLRSLTVALGMALATRGAIAADSVPIPQPPQFPVRAYILLDFATGRVLAENKSAARMEPASLTKLMTGYIVFDALKRKRLTMAEPVTISERAWRSEGSRSFMQVGTHIPVEALVKGMIVQSGNDATIALSEKVGGTEEGFVQMMNAQARRLELTGTHFQNSWGGPAPQHFSTARDLALLSQALIRDFPEYYRLYSLREYVWGGIRQVNRNGLLGRDGVDGIKTGHTETALYGLASSANRNGMRLIAVVLGAPSVKAREDASATLLSHGFNFYETLKVRAGKQMMFMPRIFKGEEDYVRVGTPRDVFVTVARGEGSRLQKVGDTDKPLIAPVAAGKRVGTYRILLDGKQVAQVPLVTLEAVPEAGFFGRVSDSVRLWFQ